jgi:hypothetical protein
MMQLFAGEQRKQKRQVVKKADKEFGREDLRLLVTDEVDGASRMSRSLMYRIAVM